MTSAPESDSEASLSLDDCDVPVIPVMPLLADDPVAPSVPATPPTPASGSGAKVVSCSVTLAEDGRNYIPWQTLGTAVIQDHPDAYKVISGDLVVCATGYDQANALAKTIILNSISQRLIATHFSNGIADASAKDLLKTLKTLFGDTSNIGKDSALSRYYNYRYNRVNPLQRISMRSNRSSSELILLVPR